MAATQPERGDQASAGLTLNLGSNNPFRNRAVSPSLHSPNSPFDDPPPRPTSTNPFLDPSVGRAPNQRPVENMSNQFQQKKPSAAADLFDALTLDDKPEAPTGSGRAPPRPDAPKPSAMSRGGPSHGQESMPPHARRGPPGHRPTGSQEDGPKKRMGQDSRTSPPGRMESRRRRNSESSVREEKPPLTEEEKKKREAKLRERELRSKTKPASRKLDTIDFLDRTHELFGMGAVHHDGPFDACNPHRNRQGSRRAPMQAFAKDSPNNTIGGSGPLNKKADHATFMGHGDEEAFRDYSAGKKERSGSNSYAGPVNGGGSGEMPVFDPLSRGAILHGDESLGLGTSTFLEGTPAARTDIQRREKERADAMVDGGIARKKSLAHRIRNINRPQQGFNPSGRMTNPEGAYPSRRTPSGSYPTSSSMQSPKDERNPFFEEFSKGEELISVRESGGEPRSPRGPEQSLRLERRATSEAPTTDESRQGGGLLARVKSLKGGRRTRPAPPASYPAPPGQAV